MTITHDRTYVVASARPWVQEIFHERTPSWPGRWVLFTSPEDLTANALETLAPRYIFFPHWSWKVPESLWTRYECVCFHMTDVPYGRGGSPLQNLILRGHRETQLSALRMVAEMDAGPIYMKCSLALEGRAQAIYERATELTFDMMKRMIEEEPTPVSQSGEPVHFERRKPAQSILPAEGSLEQLCDFIRMLDADGYPRAFVEYGDYRLEFENAEKHEGELQARVRITRRGDQDAG